MVTFVEGWNKLAQGIYSIGWTLLINLKKTLFFYKNR